MSITRIAFPVTVGVGHAKIPVGHLADIFAFLMAHYGHINAFEPGETGDQGRIVLEFPVAVKFHKIGKEIVNIIERMGPVEMARKLRALPV